MSVALERLKRLAGKRVRQPEHSLSDYVRDELVRGIADDWLVPESFSLGFHTPFWEDLNEEERLALNHWIYSFMYTRIGDGEVYVLKANEVIAEYLRPHAPLIARLLQRELREEQDHIAAFGLAKDAVDRHLGIERVPQPKKPGRALMIHHTTTRSLLRAFGVDYVITYFVARGVANHMGKGFELPVGAYRTRNAGLQRLSLLHTHDESHHMAVSRLLAACAPELVPSPRHRQRNAVYRRMVRTLHGSVAYYTFSDALSKTMERKMAHAAVPRISALRGRSPAYLRELIEAHFDSLSGIERSRNKSMGRPNQKLIEEAALGEDDRTLWFETLRENQGNLRFFPQPVQA